MSVTIAHTETTLQLAQKESAEQMHGMKELYDAMRKRPLRVKAYSPKDPNVPSKAKLVHLIRHGQAFHNFVADLTREAGKEWIQFVHSEHNPYTRMEVTDAPLTEKGRLQAAALQTVLDDELGPTPQLLIVSSPNTRALQTCCIAFQNVIMKMQQECAIDRKLVVAHELVREETGVHVCDQRRASSQLARDFPVVDLSQLTTEDDPLFHPDKRETKAQVGNRIYQFLEWLEQRPEHRIGIVSHSGWLLTLMNGVCEVADAELKDWFQTGELRSVLLDFTREDCLCVESSNVTID